MKEEEDASVYREHESKRNIQLVSRGVLSHDDDSIHSGNIFWEDDDSDFRYRSGTLSSDSRKTQRKERDENVRILLLKVSLESTLLSRTSVAK